GPQSIVQFLPPWFEGRKREDSHRPGTLLTERLKWRQQDHPKSEFQSRPDIGFFASRGNRRPLEGSRAGSRISRLLRPQQFPVPAPVPRQVRQYGSAVRQPTGRGSIVSPEFHSPQRL